MLTLSDVHVYYGAVHALKGVSLEVHEGEIVTLIGANGAGKTTTIKAISGLLPPMRGNIEFLGRRITKLPAHIVNSLGIIQIPEGRRVFPEMSVLENLEMGAFRRKDRAGIRRDMVDMFERFPRLRERMHQPAATLSGGEQQMLAVARALMARPRLLLLDEPSMGLAPILVEGVFETIKQINSEGMTILLVEQNARMALAIADRAYVLQTGEVMLSGDAGDLLQSEEVRKVYLGEEV